MAAVPRERHYRSERHTIVRVQSQTGGQMGVVSEESQSVQEQS